jgi:Tol biopolymer transport system component
MKKDKITILYCAIALMLAACEVSLSEPEPAAAPPHEEHWGIYSLNLETQDTELIYTSTQEITKLIFSPEVNRFAMAQTVGSGGMESQEIFALAIDGNDLQRLTDNNNLDTYPAWSPDGSSIAYLSMSDTLDIYLMAADGSGAGMLYDSGHHDADVDWTGDLMAFTRNSQIWVMNSDGTEPRQITDPPQAGEWGNTNLPFGDYDPRVSPDGTKIAFERLVDDSSPHGNYEIFTVDIDGSNLTQITDTGYSQGLAIWSGSGNEITYIVTSIDDVGQYDIYMVNADGTENRNITPDTWLPDFLVHWIAASGEDNLIYFIGEWWVGE